jgi:UDP-3-O-[3-hydroxymyristoyl] glucosamine N-acyltransferase
MRLVDIAQKIDGKLIGNPEYQILGLCTLFEPKKQHLSFLLEKQYLKCIPQKNLEAIICFREVNGIENQIIVENTRKSLALTIDLFSNNKKQEYCISDKAAINESANIAKNVFIDDFVKIGPNSKVKENSLIGSNVSIGENCILGANCHIYPNVVIYDNSEIGDNVIIHAGSVIGSDGFGNYEEAGKWFKIPHIGKVIIGNDVEIGANVCIDRGCVGNTVIRDGVKLDNLCHIAHNTIIGENSAIAAQFGSLGSAELGSGVRVGGQVGISRIKVGNNSIIAAKAGVTKDVPKNSFYSGFPAQPHKEELIKEALLRKLVNKLKYNKGAKL